MIDTRDLQTEKEDLQEQVLQSFLEDFPQYEDMTDIFEDICFEEEEIQSWKEGWLDEIESITDIERLEDEVGEEWEYGVTLIEEDDFEDYSKELAEDCGGIPKDLPMWIEIDWEATANNLRQDYSELNFRGTTYLFR